MEITDYHSKFFAQELKRRCAFDEVDKLVPLLADAQVDLDPHRLKANADKLFASKARENSNKFKTVRV
ncbi:MAG: hypothetical protein MUC36_27460 [Planctomycetes bacterium]|jgi:hypothetical protein|nr:hypothetical protein [Planctomycetota bacterium]